MLHADFHHMQAIEKILLMTQKAASHRRLMSLAQDLCPHNRLLTLRLPRQVHLFELLLKGLGVSTRGGSALPF